MDKGKLKQTSQDMWKFNPADYAKRWNESPNAPDQVRLTKQAALMDKVGTPFILQQSNPIWIEGRSVRQAVKVGGKFTFKKSPAVKDAEKLNGKRDMRKKFVKSSRPTYKRRIRKGQVGMRFVSYVPVNNPTIDYTDITNPINPFSEYYIPTTYNTEQALVVPEREDSKSDTVEEIPVIASKPIAEPVVNKPVASKVVVNTTNSTWSSPYKDKSKWAADLTNAYKRAGITNDNAIRMLVSQDALESAWGRSAQGKFNFGNLTTGAKWKGDYVTGNDKNAKGEAIKQKFRSYNSMDEYAADKVQFLKRLYDFEENDDINKFVAKLTGSNKGKRRYAEARNYADTLKKVYNSYRSGGIIKYQNPAQPIKYMGGYDKRGNIVLPVTNENGMNNVTLPEVTVTPRNINLAGAVDKGRREAAPYISTLLAGTMYRPSKEQEAELAYNVRQYFKRPEGRDYFRQSRATEQTARGTQIKNYYGLNEGNQDITPAMWEYARRNYVKDTGINNNMTEWLNSVDERDIIAFTKWLSKHSPAIAAPLIGGTLYDDK